MWTDADDQIIGGDLTAALAYVTPAGGAVLTPIAPLGLRDREAGTVSFTTSLGFGRKLDRIKANPKVSLAYHAREHGFATGPAFVLVQGTASYDATPDIDVLTNEIGPASVKFMGDRATGPFWDRWLSAYYADRVVVTVAVTRVVTWPDHACSGEPTVSGEPLLTAEPEPQAPPKNGTGPRIDVGKVAARVAKLPHVLAGYPGADGFPHVVSVKPGAVGPAGIQLTGSLASGGRRAGLLAHRYEAKLIGLESRQYTGWLDDGVYAPHTQTSIQAPANKTVLLLANGFMARRGLKKAKAMGRA